MRKLFLILLFLLSSIFINNIKAQAVYDFSYEYGYTWKLSGKAYCGVGEAYCMVTRSQYVNENGSYVYQVYFSSNSFFTNCSPAHTYIPDIEVMYYDENEQNWFYPLNYYKFWINADQKTLGYILYHPNPLLKIKIRVGHMMPTVY